MSFWWRSGQEAEPEGRVFDELLPAIDEACEVGALDDPMVASEGDGHDEASDDLVGVVAVERRDFGRKARQDSASSEGADGELTRGRQERMCVCSAADGADVAESDGACWLQICGCKSFWRGSEVLKTRDESGKIVDRLGLDVGDAGREQTNLAGESDRDIV